MRLKATGLSLFVLSSMTRRFRFRSKARGELEHSLRCFRNARVQSSNLHAGNRGKNANNAKDFFARPETAPYNEQTGIIPGSLTLLHALKLGTIYEPLAAARTDPIARCLGQR